MTREVREEVIYQLERCIHNAKVSGNIYSHFELAIEALKVEPCEDAIRRQEVLDLAKKGVLISNDNYKCVCRAINDLPSVNPVNTGHWKQISPAKIYECSVCGQNVMTNDIVCYKYCHGCGAKMEGSDAL